MGRTPYKQDELTHGFASRCGLSAQTVNDRISVPKAVRRTGVSGVAILRAIFDGELSTVLDEGGVDTVDPDEVDAWASRRAATAG